MPYAHCGNHCSEYGFPVNKNVVIRTVAFFLKNEISSTGIIFLIIYRLRRRARSRSFWASVSSGSRTSSSSSPSDSRCSSGRSWHSYLCQARSNRRLAPFLTEVVMAIGNFRKFVGYRNVMLFLYMVAAVYSCSCLTVLLGPVWVMLCYVYRVAISGGSIPKNQ